MATTKRTVLITGCSGGGIGAALAVEYQRNGYYVYATTRNTKKIPASLTSLPNVATLSLDVTSPKSIEDAVRAVAKDTNGSLDVLINNSGTALSAPVLDTDLEVARNMFEVNVIGVLAVTKAFATLLVKGKKPVVVNNSSINGETQLPFSGVYGASKAASTIMSETLRLEVAPLGIRVVTLVTGIINTNLHDNELPHNLPADSFYKPVEEWIESRKGSSGPNHEVGMPVTKYATQVVQSIERGSAGKLYVGVLAPMFQYVKWWLPGFIWDRIMIKSGPPNWYKVLTDSIKKGKTE